MKIITNTKTLLAVLTLLFVSSFIAVIKSIPVSAYSVSITTSGSLTANVVPAVDNGIGTTIVTDEVNVTSDCRAGYTLTIAGPSDNNLYLNGDSTNNTAGTYFTPVNGTSALNNSANANKWGYSLTANTKTGVFSALSSTATTLKTPSQTASPSSDIDDDIPVYYGTAVSSDMAPGSYTFANSTSITYAVTMEPSCTTFLVQYQDNGADNPNGMGTTDASTGEKSVKQTNIAEDTNITLLAPNFKKAGYAFLGWSTDSQAYTHFTDNDATNDPVIYGPMEDVVIDADIIATANSRNQINMYAVWIPALKDGSNNTIYMQEWDNTATTLPHDGCSTLTATVFDDTITDEKGKITVNKNSVVALTDKRDNMVYAVARLADGNCWMIENLRLEHQYTKGQNQNDPTVTNQYLSQGYGGTTDKYGNFVGLAEPESPNSSNPVPNSIYKSDGSGDVFNPANNMLEDIGTSNNPVLRFPRYNSNNTQSLVDSITYTQDYTNASSPSDSGTNYRTSSNIYGYGNYYTWPAARANTNDYVSSSDLEMAGTSICPSGWHLPSSNGTTKEFGFLSTSYGGNGSNQSGVGAGDIMSNRFRTYPNNFLYSGMWAGSTRDRGSKSYYWSRTIVPAVNSGCLVLDSTRLNPSNSLNRNNLANIRCLIGASDVEVTLDSNNGTGAISRVYGTAGSTVTLPSSSNPSASIAVLGYSFKNWNTARDGSGTSYTSSYAIPAGSTGITLYAQWYAQYTITYVNNCYTYASANTSCTQDASSSTGTQKINLDASGNGSATLGAYNYNSWTLTGWKIAGWSTVADNSSGTNPEYMTNSTYSVTGQSAGDGITLYAHWKPLYSIQYDGNNADNPNGMGTTDASTGVKSVKQTNVSEGDPVTLLASNFKRAGYGFAGWSTDPDAWSHFTDNNSSNDPVIYGPMETIDAPAYPTNGTNIITLYAVWVPAATSGGHPVYLQDWNSCSSLTSASFNSTTGAITASKNGIIALTDKRDDEVYTIAKLADGNCWMIENLRLEHEGTVGNNKNDSSVTNQSLSQGYGGTPGTYGSFVGLAASESANFNNTTSNTIYKSSANPPIDTYDPANNVLEDIGTNESPNYRFPRYNNLNNSNSLSSPTYSENYGNVTNPSTSGTYKGSNVSSYSNYYTWPAAMANTNYYLSGSTASENANTSICPYGWHLPSSNGASKEFGTLSQRYGGTGSNQSNTANAGDIMSNRFRAFPNNFLYAGGFSNSSSFYRGSSGYYLSRSSNGGHYADYLELGSYSLLPSRSYYGKYYGFSIRCLTSGS